MTGVTMMELDLTSQGQKSARGNRDTRHLPLIRQHSSPCDFQKNKSPRRPRFQSETTAIPESSVPKKTALSDKLPEIMARFKAELRAKAFIGKTRRAVERHRRVERPWVKGNEISPFFHVWQTCDDHLKDRQVRGKTVRRTRSIPKNFRVTDLSQEKAFVPEISAQFGVIRECCSHPRIRVNVFPGT